MRVKACLKGLFRSLMLKNRWGTNDQFGDRWTDG
jgi:hypothetical protein